MAEDENEDIAKISYIEYLEMVGNPETSNETILLYSLIERGETGFNFIIKPNPERVDMTPFETELENAMRGGNWAARLRREGAVKLRLAKNDTRPFLVSEGDSWFQFPVLIDEVIDHLGRDFTIASSGAAGDTADNMVSGKVGRGGSEYLSQLWKHRSRVAAFLFSAAGNDIIGEDVLAGDATPVLRKILRPPQVANPGVIDVINITEMRRRLDKLEQTYRTVVSNVRRLDSSDRPSHLPSFQKLPILIHGYDYPFPYPTTPEIGGEEKRNPIYAAKDQWLGSAYEHHGISDPELRRKVMLFLIDQLYEMMTEVAGNSQHTNVWLVDCRGTLTKVSDWNDEIHGTTDGFAKISMKFKATLDKTLAPMSG